MQRRAMLFRRTPGARLHPITGFYTALAMFLPLLVFARFGLMAFGGLVMFGTLLTAFADPGVSSHLQKKILLIVAIGGALLTALGRLIGGPWWLEGIEIFVAVFFSGMLVVYGRGIAGIGSLLTVILLLSLSTPGGPATALPSATGFLLGGFLLLLFALVFSELQGDHRAGENETHAPLPPRTLSLLTTQFTWASPLMRFQVLRAMGATAAALIGWNLSGSYPYWAALTVILCAQPDKQTSKVLVFQNIIATILGAVLADLIIAQVHYDLVIGMIVVSVTFLVFTFKGRNTILHLFFFTNLILLVISIGTTGAEFILWRVLAILIGGGIVLVLTWLNQTPLIRNDAMSEASGT